MVYELVNMLLTHYRATNSWKARLNSIRPSHLNINIITIHRKIHQLRNLPGRQVRQIFYENCIVTITSDRFIYDAQGNALPNISLPPNLSNITIQFFHQIFPFVVALRAEARNIKKLVDYNDKWYVHILLVQGIVYLEKEFRMRYLQFQRRDTHIMGRIGDLEMCTYGEHRTGTPISRLLDLFEKNQIYFHLDGHSEYE
jgi:hypothetical protein